MNSIFLIIYIFLKLLYIIIIIDIILSWLKLAGMDLRIKFIQNILEPIYERIKNTIPTTVGVFEFSPIILILFIIILEQIIFNISPEAVITFKNFLNI